MRTAFQFATLIVACVMSASWSFAQDVDVGVPHVEPIANLSIVPGQPIVLSYPNEFDLIHHKLLTLTGAATLIDSTGQPPFNLTVRFNWLDPSNPTGGLQFSDPIPIPLSPGATPIDLSYTIPFCPQEVSVDFAVDNAFVRFDGSFTHTCVIPEPSSLLLALVGVSGMVVVARRARKRI